MKRFWVQSCLKLAASFSHWCLGSDIRTNFFQFLNLWEIQISSKKSFITTSTAAGHDHQDVRGQHGHCREVRAGTASLGGMDEEVHGEADPDLVGGLSGEGRPVLHDAARRLLEQQLHVPVRRRGQLEDHDDGRLPADEIRIRRARLGEDQYRQLRITCRIILVIVLHYILVCGQRPNTEELLELLLFVFFLLWVFSLQKIHLPLPTIHSSLCLPPTYLSLTTFLTIYYLPTKSYF